MSHDGFPCKELVTVPLGRPHNYTILAATRCKASITEATVERALFDRAVKDAVGNLLARSRVYDLPTG